MMKIFGLWSLAFVIKIVLSFLTLYYSFQSNLKNNLMKLLLMVIINIVTDIGPCLSVLEFKFIDLFKQMRKDLLRLDSIDESISR
jgi:hypothetical protein